MFPSHHSSKSQVQLATPFSNVPIPSKEVTIATVYSLIHCTHHIKPRSHDCNSLLHFPCSHIKRSPTESWLLHFQMFPSHQKKSQLPLSTSLPIVPIPIPSGLKVTPVTGCCTAPLVVRCLWRVLSHDSKVAAYSLWCYRPS